MNWINKADITYSYGASHSINTTALIVNIVIFLVVIIGCIILFWKIKIPSRGYKLLFIFYTFFWFPLMLVRSYRGALNNDLEVNHQLMWVPLTVYGLVGILARPLFDYFGGLFKSRKTIIYFALWLQVVSFLPIVFYPSFATNVIQSIGVGLGASCIGSFSLWFNEQHTKNKPFLTISILSLPPLMADFLASPIQSIIRSTAPYGSSNPIPVSEGGIALHPDPKYTAYLWIIALIVILISFILGYFVKENRELVGLQKQQNKQIISKKWDWLVLIGIILVGASIDFTKFATADSIATTNIQQISGGSINSKTFEGYTSSVFSVFQLIGGILMGLVGIRYFSKIAIYAFGACFFIIYDAAVIGIVNNDFGSIQGGISYLGVQALNGFGYGILYNLLIAHVLSLGFKTKRFSPLGIYQMFAAISIACGTFFTSFLNAYVKASFQHTNLIINSTLIAVTSVVGIVYYFVNYISNDFSNKALWKIKHITV